MNEVIHDFHTAIFVVGAFLKPVVRAEIDPCLPKAMQADILFVNAVMGDIAIYRPFDHAVYFAAMDATEHLTAEGHLPIACDFFVFHIYQSSIPGLASSTFSTTSPTRSLPLFLPQEEALLPDQFHWRHAAYLRRSNQGSAATTQHAS